MSTSEEGPEAKRLRTTPGHGWTNVKKEERTGGSIAAGDDDPDENEDKVCKIASAVATIIEALGEDPKREGLVKTPRRMAELLVECTQGYKQELPDVLNGAVFHEDFSEMVVVKDINIFSLCEHHLVPFFGKVHIAYIPRSKVLGLSKLARIADMYARRLQVQERLTKQIATAVKDAIQPLGVGVVIEAQHMCMAMRGARQPSSSTITSSVLGCFQSDSRTRAEFFANIGRRTTAL
mmetsp:Transcript_15555/g.48648  ORF Transcript_15555/g.48648 Transcript_15555/m.48648 type:complete len:236 (+) Transcript_15555:59-766(+)